MKNLTPITVFLLLSVFGTTSTANAFDVTGAVWFNFAGDEVNTRTGVLTLASENVDQVLSLALLKVKNGPTEIVLESENDECEGATFLYAYCNATIRKVQATPSSTYCNRGNGQANDLPSNELLFYKELENVCNTTQGEDEVDWWWAPFCWGTSNRSPSLEIATSLGAVSFRYASEPVGVCWAVAVIGEE